MRIASIEVLKPRWVCDISKVPHPELCSAATLDRRPTTCLTSAGHPSLMFDGRRPGHPAWTSPVPRLVDRHQGSPAGWARHTQPVDMQVHKAPIVAPASQREFRPKKTPHVWQSLLDREALRAEPGFLGYKLPRPLAHTHQPQPRLDHRTKTPQTRHAIFRRYEPTPEMPGWLTRVPRGHPQVLRARPSSLTAPERVRTPAAM